MKRYYLDTNVFIRFILHDNEELYKQAYQFFLHAKQHEYEVVVLKEILLEIEYILRKIYKESRKDIGMYLVSLITSESIVVEEYPCVRRAINRYTENTIDLVDLFLYEQAHANDAQVFSFDKDFRKL